MEDGTRRGHSSARLEQFVIRPWPLQRARRMRWIVLGLMVAAPVVATALTWWGVAADQTTTVVEPAGVDGGPALAVTASALGIDLQRSEMTFRLVFQPTGELTEGGRLAQPVTVAVNDVSGGPVLTFGEGDTMGPTVVAVSLSGSELLRYPFDRYDTQLAVGAVLGGDTDGAELPLDLAVDVALDDFGVQGSAERSVNAAVVDLELARRGAVIIWVVFFMVLVWAIALGAAGTAWFIVVFAKDPPIWVYPFFAAILFALPTLRAGLPGRPPYGTLVDWASFYWGIALVAMALVALLVVWNVEARVRVREAAEQEGRRTGRVPSVPPARRED